MEEIKQNIKQPERAKEETDPEEMLERKFEKGSLVEIQDLAQGIIVKLLSTKMETTELANLGFSAFNFVKISRNKSKDSSYV